MSIRMSKTLENGVLLLLFLLAIQVKNSPATAIFGLLGVTVVLFLYRSLILPPVEFYVLSAAFTIYFLIFRQHRDLITMYDLCAYWIGPIAGYLAGFLLIAKEEEQTEREGTIRSAITVIAVGATLFAFGCMVYKQMHLGTYNALMLKAKHYYTMDGRYSLNLWTGKLIHPTNLNSLCIFTVLSLFYVLGYEKRNPFRAGYCVLLVMALSVAFSTATRTNLVMIPLGLIIGIWLDRENLKFRLTFGLVLLVVAGLFLVICLAEPIMHMLQSSQMASRTESLDNNRWNSIYNVLVLLKDYPLGNMPLGNAHNLWADVGRIAGIYPMVLLVVYSLQAVGHAMMLERKTELSSDVTLWIRLLTYGMLCSFMIEPVIEGRPFNFVFFCFINGMTMGCIRHGHRQEEEGNESY